MQNVYAKNPEVVRAMREHLAKWWKSAERETPADVEVRQIPVASIRPNRYQPRTVFDETKLDELMATIRTHGVIQPIVVRKQEDHYELVAGERRWRAVQRLGMDFMPAIIRELSDAQAGSMALIENLQRENLTAIEEAIAYQQLIELHHLTQESLAQRLGKGQSTVANKLRLLTLRDEVQDAIRSRGISERHARALIPLTGDLQVKVLQEIIEGQLNVNQTEERVKTIQGKTLAVVEKRRRPPKVAYSKDVRLAVNTVRKSMELISQTGLQVSLEERDEGEYVEFQIRIQKQ